MDLFLCDGSLANLSSGDRGFQAMMHNPRFWDTHPAAPWLTRTSQFLLSYYYFQSVDLDTIIPQYFQPPYPMFFADSGAFSAHTRGAHLSCHAYGAWLRRFQHWFSVMSNLDVIGNPRATTHNQQALEDMGLSILPVFHTGESWDILDALLPTYPYIALGGMVPYMRQWARTLMPWLIQCFKRGAGRTRFHGFGCTTWTLMRSVPWASVDSSAWGVGFRYGEIPLFDWTRGTLSRFFLGNPRSVGRVAPMIRGLGFDPQDFALRARNTRAHNCAIAAVSFALARAWLSRYWGHAMDLYLVATLADARHAADALHALTPGFSEEPYAHDCAV